ncbi:hypothetical protein AMAG_03563 [Allomyces macrogynus ATCC 38327]|uniref:TOG domain-containing protein n=1 Tax=Allomyces macrogynus (strain ATCC 38327) TaxID=578462 RepID=A0A0L0S9Y1_ALLM3|nr:hypothetical protein AMAG_03563 [Allomyces macrogynus ATCC 38327]|eukprot:KNE59252.1 hypothetical protein AMAG_03563 [Allomyces macrogynus ATCC 38327]
MQGLQRDISKLSDPATDRSAKRRTLDGWRRSVVDPLMREKSPPLTLAVTLALAPCLARLLRDKVEKCRELSGQILTSLISDLMDVKSLLPTLVPALVDRLARDDQPEPSEEIRLDNLRLLVTLADKSGSMASLITADVCSVLDHTLVDSYPEVRKESCKAIVLLAVHAPAALRLHAEKLLKRLVPSLSHRHSAVRIVALQAVGTAMQVDASIFKEIWPSVRKLALDSSPAVRQQLYTVALNWQTQLVDRYSYAACMLSVLIGGLSDEVLELRAKCQAAIANVSRVYETEWAERVKDKLDYEPNRTLIGFRTLVHENLLKMTDSLVEDLGDWTVEVRRWAAQTLAQLLPFAEGHISGYLGKLLPALAKVVHEPFAPLVFQTASAIGQYVAPDLLLHLMVPHLRTPSYLALLVHALNKSPIAGSHINTILKEMQDLAENDEAAAIADPNLKSLYLIPLARSGAFAAQVDIDLLLSIGLAIADDTVLNAMTTAPVPLFARVPDSLVNLAKRDLAPRSPQLYLVKRFLKLAPPAVVFSASALVPILERLSADATTDDSGIEAMAEVLDVILPKADQIPADVASTLWLNVIVRHLRWRSGRKAVQLRVRASALAQACLAKVAVPDLPWSDDAASAPPTQGTFAHPPPGPLTATLTALSTAMDDDPVATRRTVVTLVLRITESWGGQWDPEHVKVVYPDLVKRLDDAQDPVRVLSCAALAAVYDHVPAVMQLDLVHHQELVKSVAIHVDDPNPDVMNAALATLRAMFRVQPDAVKAHIDSTAHLFRNASAAARCADRVFLIDSRHRSAVLISALGPLPLCPAVRLQLNHFCLSK